MGKYTPEQYKLKLERWMRRMPQEVKRVIEQATQIVRTEALTAHLSGPKMPRGVGSATDATLQPRTGDLRASVFTRTTLEGGRIRGLVGSNLRYARIHEYGGATGIGRRVNMPERSYLRSSLRAKQREIMELILKGATRDMEKR